MYNWLKSLFGFSKNNENERVENDLNSNNAINDSLVPLEHECNCHKMPLERLYPEEMWTNVPHFFMDPFQIHKHFDKLMEDMANKLSMFGFDSSPSLGFEDGENDFSSYFEQPGAFSELPPVGGNMRDYVLNRRPGSHFQTNEKRDYVLNDQISTHEVKDLIENRDQKSNALHPLNKNQSFGSFQSVVVKISKQPDGSVHIIKKVKDSSGKDETTYTVQSNK